MKVGSMLSRQFRNIANYRPYANFITRVRAAKVILAGSATVTERPASARWNE
jgi:hypothetical protein